ncbi:sorting nexin-11-like isoform X1 [Stegostoma tigrinum]|uniref:sorting nexin-11-like isoform X1 n=1 Tax=Stegostoma tigrinum TaxID=3053191 RepID=UPI00202B5B9D|nr:sorting nexin-11-like isoform X1 [Stegostoma tigrinum]XP_048416896.1 sorting nexin-11-like isoform X1 [Stegostoma tigrinum]XP_048416897.1 sorting nexin-11-like isoform X1 [Stegostoma tigrinum]XP_059494791.1 sorting nexin-11-like isoform X1 [Stegostoma tigrinum]
MMKGQEEEEFITVRVQDPRIQDQNSWAAYVDYKIFLYTNSKAFTVKTSCVRRRYREFVWLRRQLQKNAGLVPLPELPGKKPFFQVNDIESIERRRQGLQQFLEKVLHTTVFLSDSQLHLFLQTQLPPAQIEACAHGRTPFSVNKAILDNAMCRKSILLREDAEAVGYECGSSPSPPNQVNDVETSDETPATREEPAASERI